MWTDYVKLWLAQHERTQAWLARKAEMSDSQLNHLLAGHHKPGSRVLRRMEQAMGLDSGMLEAFQAQGALPIDNSAHANKEA